MDIAIFIVAEIFEFALPMAAILWEKIAGWTVEVLFTWLTENLAPKVVELSTETLQFAFMALSTVAVGMFGEIKRAWKALRKYLLELVLRFERNASKKWIKRWSSKLIKILDEDKSVVVKREIEEVINWEDLPPELRAEHLRFSKDHYTINYAEIRDKEMESMTVAH